MHRREEIAHVQHSDDVVERLAVDRVAGVGRLEHCGEGLLGRQLRGDRDDLRSRHHHVGDVLVAEDEDLVDHLLFLVLDLALLARAREQHAELRLGERLALGARRLEPEQVEDAVGRLAQHPDERREEREEDPHRRRDPERGALRMAERDALRDELAEHDVEERQQQVGEGDREHCRHPGLERVRERLLAERTDTQRGQRDAELHRGDELRRIARDPQDRAGPAVSLVVKLDDPRPPGRHERVLGRDEEGVQQDQDPDADQLESESHAPTPGAHVLDGSSSTSGAASIGNAPVVLAAVGPSEHDEPFEMGERLGDRESPLDRSELASEEIVRNLVPRPGLRAERRFGAVEALLVVRDDRGTAGDGVLHRPPVTAEGDARREAGDESE